MQHSQAVLGDLGSGGEDFYTQKDETVPRHRRIYMVLEQSAVDPPAFTISKAKWEMSRRTGRSCEVHVTIDSWTDSNGVLWAPNTLIPVNLPGFPDSYSPLCLSSVTFRKGEGGTHAELTLLPQAAFTPEPITLIPVNLADLVSAP